MTSVREALESLQEPVESQCKIGDWIDTLPQDEQDDVAAMFDMQVSDIKLTSALQPVFRVSREMVRQHRGMTCRCFR